MQQILIEINMTTQTCIYCGIVQSLPGYEKDYDMIATDVINAKKEVFNFELPVTNRSDFSNTKY